MGAKKLMKVIPSKKDVDKEGVENETTLTKIMTYLFGSYKNVEWVPKTQQEIEEESDGSSKTGSTSLEAAFALQREESSIVLNDDVWNEMSHSSSSPPVAVSNSTSQSPISTSLSVPQQQKNNNNSKKNESQEAADFSRRWGFLYEQTDSLTFACMDIICNVLISFSAGLMQNPDASNTFCQANAIFTLIVHVPPTLFVLVKRPLMSRFDLVVGILLWIGSFITSLLVLLSFSSGSDLQEALDSFSTLGFIALLSGVSDVARVIVDWVQKRNLKRRKKFGKSQVKNQTKEFEIDWSGLVAQNSADQSNTNNNNDTSNDNKNNKDFQFDELMKFLETPAEDPDDNNENDDVDDAVAAFMNEPPTAKPTAQEATIQTTASDEELEEMIMRNNNNNDNDDDDDDDENEEDRIAIGAAKNEELEKRRRDMANMFSHG